MFMVMFQEEHLNKSRDAVNKVPVTYKKGLETQLGRLVDVLNEKYSPEVIRLKLCFSYRCFL